MALRLTTAIPVLPVLNLQAALQFYERQFGFQILFRYDDYAGLRRDAVVLHLYLCGDPAQPQGRGCRIEVDDIPALYDDFARKGVVHPQGPLAEKPWGYREFTAVDQDGNLIVFAEKTPGFVPR